MTDTAKLIERLVAEAEPVRRLRPPAVRALLWLAAVALAGGLAILSFANLGVFANRIEETAMALEWGATLVTGIAAVLAAFELSLPDRSQAWALLPLPSLGVWIGSSGYACYRDWVVAGPSGWQLGDSANCFMFILAFSIPLAASLLLLLRRAMPLHPVRVAAVGALGVSALAAAALQFFHPFDVTFLDLGIHLGTVALVVLGVSVVEYFADARRPLHPA